MTLTPDPTNLTRQKFAEILSRYPTAVSTISAANPVPNPGSSNAPTGAQMTLTDLDNWRLETIQRTLESREKPFLTKVEAEMLLACKMRRGKHRAGLPKLLATNPSGLIQSATASAFACLTSSPSTETILAAIKVLVDAIKGVGPATASYILALIHPTSVPVFSDEGYRWVLYTNSGRGNDGWHRKIKYDLKEYKLYLDTVKALMGRLGDGVTAQDVEKVGFVLGKEVTAEFTRGKVGNEDTTTVNASSKAAKKPTNAETLGTALEVVDAPALVDVQATRLSAPGLTGSTSSSQLIPPQNYTPQKSTKKAPIVTKRKRKADSYNSDADTDDIRQLRSRKVKVGPAIKGGKKIGQMFTGRI